MSGVSKPYSELYSAVTIRSKIWHDAKLVKDAIKKLLLTELKRTRETSEPVR
jgi:hypothetical protein